MTPPVVLYVQDGRLAADVPSLAKWDGIETLWRYLEQYWNALCHNRIEGPDARVWRVEIRQHYFDLECEDPYSTRLVSPGAESDALLREIARDLERRLPNLA